jgi:uncharacterized protein GlcG (DUF336 family)
MQSVCLQRVKPKPSKSGSHTTLRLWMREGTYWLSRVRRAPLIGSIDLAIHKAFTARACDISTGDLAVLAQPGKPLYGIHGSNAGKIVIFGGGLPIRRMGVVVGAIGTSAGTVEQDIQVAEAAVEAIEPSIQPASVRVS